MQQPMETTVKTYDNPKDYQKDLQRMQQQGWSVQNVIDHQNERSLAGKLFVPGGLFTKGKSQIVVTYQRVAGQYHASEEQGEKPGYAADGHRMTLKENIELAKRKRQQK